MLGVVAITAATFFLDAVFAFAIARPGPPEIRPAFTKARSHAGVVLCWGVGVGLLLGFSTVVVVRWGLWWFALSLSIVLGIMMVCYVSVPARLIGVRTTRSRRDKFTAAAVGGALGAVVTSPPYLLGRIGILMLGSHTLFILGIILLCVGGALKAGAEGAVKAVKVSAKLVIGHRSTMERCPRQRPMPSGSVPLSHDRKERLHVPLARLHGLTDPADRCALHPGSFADRPEPAFQARGGDDERRRLRRRLV